MNLYLVVAFSITIALLIIAALFLLNGKGAFLIAGYNTLSKARKAKYDEKILCRAVAWLLLALAFCLVILQIGTCFNLSWLVSLAIVLMLIITVGFVIYSNTGKRFLKNPTDLAESESSSKPRVITMASISTIALFAIVALSFLGVKDPVVCVLDSGIEIKAIYGVEINFAEISDISLIEQSMKEIGVGMRMNGYAGVGQALKGHFRSNNTSEDFLLFVQSNTSPTIKIERCNNQTIYINLRNVEKTRRLYKDMEIHFQ